MKRSQINASIREALALFDEYKIALPPFTKWTPAEWKDKGDEVAEIKENMLGWDITDFGQGDFDKIGLFLITLRNGNQKNPEKYKTLVVRVAGYSALFTTLSRSLQDDIINRTEQGW